MDNTKPTSRYLVVSDLHLSDIEDHADGWKAHKSARHAFDDELGELLRWFRESGSEGAELTLVLNGDVFDFDLVTAVPTSAPWPISRAERRFGLEPTPSRSVWKLQRILQDHPRFLQALEEFLTAGHRIVYVMGNHDREFHFEQVQAALIEELQRTAARAGRILPSRSLEFEPWFFHVAGVLYAEHGQQYDYYSSFRHVLHPELVRKGERTIALPMGNLSNRFLVNRMGYFNPHASDYILDLFRYASHWMKYYALARRSLVVNWFWGSMRVMGRLLAYRQQYHAKPRRYDLLLEAAAQRAALPVATLEALARLHKPPITTRFYRIVREFWIDRLVMLIGMLAATFGLALTPAPLSVKIMLPLALFPLIGSAYERLAQGDTIFTVEHQVPEFARTVSELLQVRVVTFGHTHRPRVIPLAKGTSFVDTGTWAPAGPHARGKATIPGFRNYLVVESDDRGVTMSLGSWMQASGPERDAEHGAAARVVHALTAIRKRVSHV